MPTHLEIPTKYIYNLNILQTLNTSKFRFLFLIIIQFLIFFNIIFCNILNYYLLRHPSTDDASVG